MNYLRILFWTMVAIYILANASRANADWVCTTQSALVISEGTTTVCGIGESENEAEARELAHAAALREFNNTCNASSDCAGNKVFVKPLRTQCDLSGKNYKCYRAFSFTVSDEASNLDEELARQQAKLNQIREEKEKERDVAQAKREIKFESENPSYWNLGLGVTFNSVSLGGYDALQVGYGLNFKRCFSDRFCPYVGATVGQIKFDHTESTGSFYNVCGGASLYVYRPFYLFGTAGMESLSSQYESKTTPVTNAGVGVDAIRVKNFSISIEGGVKTGPETPATGTGAIFGNFKF